MNDPGYNHIVYPSDLGPVEPEDADDWDLERNDPFPR